jgi:three-Cys-motif partner protein
MTLPDNHPMKWNYPEHTAVKHRILDNYLKTWISIRGSTVKELGYIDGFAGRGIYEDGSYGSPIIAMNAAQEKIDNVTRSPKGMEKFRCFFVEKNEDNYMCLKSQIDSLAPRCKDVLYNLKNGTFEDAARVY